MIFNTNFTWEFIAMKAMLLEQIAPIDTSPLKLVDLPMPEPGPGEVRIKVRCCAICRTDLHVIEGDLPQQKMPIIPGHQIVGTVDKLGPGLHQSSRPGSAWAWPGCGIPAASAISARPARKTSASRPASPAIMPTADTPSTPSRPRPFATEFRRAFSDVEAAPLLCAGIIGYRSLQRCNLPPGGKLGIYGFGSSAHVVIQIALHRGCEVYVVTRGENHRAVGPADGRGLGRRGRPANAGQGR